MNNPVPQWLVESNRAAQRRLEARRPQPKPTQGDPQ